MGSATLGHSVPGGSLESASSELEAAESEDASSPVEILRHGARSAEPRPQRAARGVPQEQKGGDP